MVAMLLRMVLVRFNTVNGKYCCNITIEVMELFGFSFNTVNGKYCCNKKEVKNNMEQLLTVQFQYRKR